MIRTTAPAAALIALLLLTACGDDPAPAETPVEDTPIETPAPTAPEPTPVAPPAPVANVAEAAPEEVDVDQQVQDDADATGMTARVDRSGETGGDVPPGEDGGVPVEQ